MVDEVVLEPAGETWQVRLPLFEGPLDLLLYLVRKQQINIYDIPIARITHQYLAYLDMMRFLNLDLAGEFLVMAATLTWIKSQMLLPRPVESPEQESEEDPRAELVRRLLEYEAVRRSAAWLEENIETTLTIRRNVPLPPLEPPPVAPLTPIDLAMAFAHLMKRRWKKIPRRYRVQPIRIEVHFEPLRDLARKRGIFQHYLRTLPTLTQWVAAFLALLHLINARELRVRQKHLFGPIRLLPPR